MWWQKDKETLKLTTLFCSFRSQIERLYELRPHFTLAFYSFRIHAVFILAATATAAAPHSFYKTLCTQSILCQSILNLFFSSVAHSPAAPVSDAFFPLDVLNLMWGCFAWTRQQCKWPRGFVISKNALILFGSLCHSIHFASVACSHFALPLCLLSVIIGICLFSHTRAKPGRVNARYSLRTLTLSIVGADAAVVSWPLLRCVRQHA